MSKVPYGLRGKPDVVIEMTPGMLKLYEEGSFDPMLRERHGHELQFERKEIRVPVPEKPGRTQIAVHWRVRLILGPFRRMPKKERDMCGARCRDGYACRARVCIRPNGLVATRCRLHGGLSTGVRTEEGRERIRESSRRRAELRRHQQRQGEERKSVLRT